MRILKLSWSVSRGRETYGYNICRLDEVRGLSDTPVVNRIKCMGGGYDMVGTVFADWLSQAYPQRLRAIADRAFYTTAKGEAMQRHEGESKLYGMTHYTDRNAVSLDGGCGIASMIRIAEAIGLTVRTTIDRNGNSSGFVVTEGVQQ